MNPTSKKSILYIDDEAEIRKLIADLLDKTGYNTDTASDGIEGLKKIKSQYYDLILLDIVMPNMDGLQMLEQMHKDNIKNGKIVILTNIELQEAKETAKNNGASDYWVNSKITPEELVRRIKDMLPNSTLIND